VSHGLTRTTGLHCRHQHLFGEAGMPDTSPASTTPRFTAVILTALEIEYKAVLDLLVETRVTSDKERGHSALLKFLMILCPEKRSHYCLNSQPQT
jgi:hypothetical protein